MKDETAHFTTKQGKYKKHTTQYGQEINSFQKLEIPRLDHEDRLRDCSKQSEI